MILCIVYVCVRVPVHQVHGHGNFCLSCPCRTPGTRQERRKTKEVKNPSLKRSVLRASLAPKISFLSQSHSLTPISSVSSFSFFSGRSPLPLLLPNMPLHILRFPTFAPLGNWVLWEIRDAHPRMTFNFFFFFF